MPFSIHEHWTMCDDAVQCCCLMAIQRWRRRQRRRWCWLFKNLKWQMKQFQTVTVVRNNYSQIICICTHATRWFGGQCTQFSVLICTYRRKHKRTHSTVNHVQTVSKTGNGHAKRAREKHSQIQLRIVSFEICIIWTATHRNHPSDCIEFIGCVCTHSSISTWSSGINYLRARIVHIVDNDNLLI